MPLFKVPQRATKQQDLTLAKKASKKTVAKQAVKSGSGILGQIEEIKTVVLKNLGQYADEYICITDEKVLRKYIDDCIRNTYISIDTETDGLDPLQNVLAGICVYTRGQRGAYIPLNHVSVITGEKCGGQLEMELVMNEFRRLLKHKPEIDMFNANFDIRFLRANGLKDIYCTWDAFLASRLLNENEPHKNLKQLHQKYCLNGQGDAFRYDDLFKKVKFTNIPFTVGFLYAAHDPVITSELCDYQRQFLTPGTEECREYELEDVAWVFRNIEMPCVQVVTEMEDNGVLFDMKYQQKLSEKYNKLLAEKEADFYAECSKYDAEISKYRMLHSKDCKLTDPINIGSPTQIAILLYDIMKLEPPDPKSPRGTGVEILAKMNNVIATKILEYREVQKLLSTYIEKLPECVNPKDGRIHCKFNQYGADTGRFSSQDPNLQNIPSHNKDIRKMFVASPGYVLMSSDYSQQEPKVMTQMCEDPKMIEAYRNNKDLYAEIAALSFNTTYRECLEFMTDEDGNWIYDDKGERITYKAGKERRSQAKSILLGVLYGRGVPSIAEQLGVSTKKAQAIKDSVFKGFPAIPKFEKDSLQMGRELGFVTTLWGRKRRLPDLSLPEYEFKWKNGVSAGNDLLDFDADVIEEVPEELQRKYLKKLSAVWGNKKRPIFEEANKEGIWIIDNGAKIADAERQCVNARIQGSAADMSKLAMILVGNDKRLKELGFRLLIPVHDELIAECPKENAKECAERFAKLMAEAAESKLTIPIKCDVEITERWYGEKVEL